MVQPGWFERQSKSVSDEIKAWPDWMRQAAGLENRQSTASRERPTDDGQRDVQPPTDAKADR
jgi:hypothetical protein